MSRVWFYVFVPAFMQLFNGCIAPPAQDVGLGLVEARHMPGPCLVGVDGDDTACQVLLVEVANREEESWAAVGREHWRAEDAQDGTWTAAYVEDETAVGPGESRVLRVGFTTPAEARLVRLHLDNVRLDL